MLKDDVNTQHGLYMQTINVYYYAIIMLLLLLHCIITVMLLINWNAVVW